MPEQNQQPKSFPSGPCTFLVIHGIGEQNPLETLDSFARGIITDLREQNVGFEPAPVRYIAQKCHWGQTVPYFLYWNKRL